jgi:hypothetical protein
LQKRDFWRFGNLVVMPGVAMRLIFTVALAGWLAVVIAQQQQTPVAPSPKKVAERLPQEAVKTSIPAPR